GRELEVRGWVVDRGRARQGQKRYMLPQAEARQMFLRWQEGAATPCSRRRGRLGRGRCFLYSRLFGNTISNSTGIVIMSDLRTDALEYHAHPRPGKLSVELTKPTATARDLALAYSPGVAEPVREIAKDADLAFKYTG